MDYPLVPLIASRLVSSHRIPVHPLGDHRAGPVEFYPGLQARRHHLPRSRRSRLRDRGSGPQGEGGSLETVLGRDAPGGGGGFDGSPVD